MAYMIDGRGPFPNKAGEFCGNYHLESSLTRNWQTPKEQVQELKCVCQLQFGRPRPCPAGTTEEMEANGYIGLYLKKDFPLGPEAIEVETPEELKEPDRELKGELV